MNKPNYTAYKFNDVNKALLNYFLPDGVCGLQSVLMVCFNLDIEVDINDFICNADKLKKMDKRDEQGYSVLDIYFAVSEIPDVEYTMYFNFSEFVIKHGKEFENSIEYLKEIDFDKNFIAPKSFDEILKKYNKSFPIFGFWSKTTKVNHFSPFDFEDSYQILHFGCPEVKGEEFVQCDIYKKTFKDECWTQDTSFGNCLIIKRKN